MSSQGQPLYPKPTPEQRRRQVQRVKAQVELVAARRRAHEAVERHRGDVREYLGLSRELAEYRWNLDAEPVWIVDLIPAVRTVIESECGAADDGTETGGYLIGYPTCTRNYSVVLGATGPGPNAERFPDAVILDRRHAEQEASRQRLEIVGAWHTHAQSAFRTFGYGGRISANDAREAARHLDELEGLAYCELIVCPGEARWNTPTIAPYVLIAQPGTEPPVVERARLK